MPITTAINGIRSLEVSGNSGSVSRLKPLFRLAVLNGLEPAVREHLRRGADVNAVDPSGQTPLMLASSAGHLDVCRVLIAWR